MRACALSSAVVAPSSGEAAGASAEVVLPVWPTMIVLIVCAIGYVRAEMSTVSLLSLIACALSVLAMRRSRSPTEGAEAAAHQLCLSAETSSHRVCDAEFFISWDAPPEADAMAGGRRAGGCGVVLFETDGGEGGASWLVCMRARYVPDESSCLSVEQLGRDGILATLPPNGALHVPRADAPGDESEHALFCTSRGGGGLPHSLAARPASGSARRSLAARMLRQEVAGSSSGSVGSRR